VSIQRIGTLLGLILIIAISLTGIDRISGRELESNFSKAQNQAMERVLGSKIVYLGETHDRDGDRQNILAILKRVTKAKKPVAIGMEMFQRHTQPTIDRYLAGKISESELLELTEYQKRWGYPWSSYATIVHYAKEQKIPIIALNTPTEITRKAAKSGIESLAGEDLKYIPPLTDLDRSNSRYRDRIFASYQTHKQNAQLNSKSFDRFYTAQLLWDETMAERVANFTIANPDRQMLVIAGVAHILYGEGIPDRVTRRLPPQERNWPQYRIILSHDRQIDPTEKPAPADFVWAVEP
jgi:uncharacterized iron-regulated protein